MLYASRLLAVCGPVQVYCCSKSCTSILASLGSALGFSQWIEVRAWGSQQRMPCSALLPSLARRWV